MFDWNKLCNSGVDLSGTGGQLLRVTPEELAMHCTEGDLWTAVRGRLEICVSVP
jgi:cytochrome-b5 reductase